MPRISKLFKKKFEETYPDLVGIVSESVDSKKRFDRELTDGKRIAFSKSSTVDSRDALEKLISPIGGRVVRPAKVSGGIVYANCGFLVEWNGTHYSVLLKAMADGISRKSLAPKNLGFNGKSYTVDSLGQLLQDVKDCLQSQTFIYKDQTNIVKSLISLVDHVVGGTPIADEFFKLSEKDQKIILCDFGEILCMIADLDSGKAKEIKIAGNSNENVSDFLRDGQVISVKGPNAGYKLNLVAYNEKLTGQTNADKFLKSMASHNREDYFKYAAALCPWVKDIADLVGGTTTEDLKNFVRKPNSHDQFYNLLRTANFPGVGLPKSSKEEDWRRRWEEEHSLDPICFSIITVMSYWGSTDKKTVNEITNIMKPLTSTEKFVTIDIVDKRVRIRELAFSEIKSWGTHYHSNAGGAWTNWPGVKALEEK